MEQLKPKKVFHKYKKYKKWKSPSILHIRFCVGSKFALQQTGLTFEQTSEIKIKTFGQKQKKLNMTIEFFLFELV